MRVFNRWITLLVVVGGLCLLPSAWVYFRSSRPTGLRVVSDLAGGPHEIIAGSGLFYLGSDPEVGNASYALRTGAGVVVIDPGWNLAQLQAAFGFLGLRIEDVRIILVTHRHADHWFCARELVEQCGATVMAHAQEVPLLMKASELEQYFSWHPPSVSHVPVLSSVRALQNGDIVELGGFKIEVIATPGHTEGSVCYRTDVRGYQVLWSGDTVDSLSAQTLGGVYMTRLGPSFGGDMRSYLQSLRNLAAIDVDILLPGHPRSNDATRVDPWIGVDRWKELLQPNIARIQTWLEKYPNEVDRFLDNTAKPLSAELLYLGEVNSVASYVLKTEEGLACIDPGERTFEDLRSVITELGASVGDVKLVLLTAVHPDHSALAPELCAETGAELACGRIDERDAHAINLKPDRLLEHGDAVQLGQTTIMALAGRRSGGADRCYLAQTSDRWVLFGGDTVGRFTSSAGSRYHSIPNDTEPETNTDVRASYWLLKDWLVEIVLPAHPYCHESPYYFPGEWSSCINNHDESFR